MRRNDRHKSEGLFKVIIVRVLLFCVFEHLFKQHLVSRYSLDGQDQETLEGLSLATRVLTRTETVLLEALVVGELFQELEGFVLIVDILRVHLEIGGKLYKHASHVVRRGKVRKKLFVEVGDRPNTSEDGVDLLGGNDPLFLSFPVDTLRQRFHIQLYQHLEVIYVRLFRGNRLFFQLFALEHTAH